MTFNSGTATNYLTLLDALIATATSRHLSAIVINAAGTGYTAGDILGITNSGSTNTLVAQIEVLTVGGGGDITAARIYRGGAYTVDPSTTTGNAATGGTGTAATFNLTFSNTGWTKVMRTQRALSATVAAGGTGYSVGNVLTVSIGSGVHGPAGAHATFTVATAPAGVVGTVTLTSAGNYQTVPDNPVATTGGAGSGCTLNVTWEEIDDADNEVILQGSGLGGLDDIFVGIQTYNRVNGFNTAYNWGLFGMTGYNDGLPFHQQPGISPGHDGTGLIHTTDICPIVPLKTTTAFDITWYASINGRRILLVAKVEDGVRTHYMHAYLGFLNAFGTTSEYAYPLYIAGSTNQDNALFNESTIAIGGLTDVLHFGSASDPVGPALLRLPDGTWHAFASANTSSTGTSRTVEVEYSIYPVGALTEIGGTSSTNGIAFLPSSGLNWASFVAASGFGSSSQLLKPTPGSGPVKYLLVPVLVVQYVVPFPDDYEIFGEIDGAFFFHEGNNGIVSLDRFEYGNDRYLVFQNGNRTQSWSFMALKEE